MRFISSGNWNERGIMSGRLNFRLLEVDGFSNDVELDFFPLLPEKAV